MFEYSEDFKKCQNVYLQFLMLLIFVPAQQAQLLPAHLRDHCTLQFPTLLFEDAVAHLKNIREERCARAQLRMTERMRLS